MPKVGFSLKNLHEEKKKKTTEKEIVKEAKNLFSEKDLNHEWRSFMQDLNAQDPAKYAILDMTKIQLKEAFEIELVFSSEASKAEFVEIQDKLANHLRSNLKNDFITLKIKVIEDKKTKHLLTKREKFEEMLKINPDLIYLKDLFDLDLYD